MGEYCPVQVPFYPRPMPTAIPSAWNYPLPSPEEQISQFKSIWGKQEEKKMNLQPGKRYLLKKKYAAPEIHLEEITVYEIAADAIKYSSAPGGFPKWVLMKYLEENFTLYAELPALPKEVSDE